MRIKNKVSFVLVCIFFISLVSATIVINDFTTDPQSDHNNNGGVNNADEFIELYNTGLSSVNLTGWNLTTNDSSLTVDTLSGEILSQSYFILLNPTGTMNNDGQLLLHNSSGDLIDVISYGSWADANVSDNAPDGNAVNINDECLARNPNARDTGIDIDDVNKTRCTFNATNDDVRKILNVPGDFGTIQAAINIAYDGDTVNISAGFYNEDLVINKSVTIKGVGNVFLDGSHVVNENDVTITNMLFNSTGDIINVDSSSKDISRVNISNSIFNVSLNAGTAIWLNGSNTFTDLVFDYNIFNGPVNMNSYPLRIGGVFDDPRNTTVNLLSFSNNNVSGGTIAINLHHKNIFGVTVGYNTFRNTNGTLYIWGQNSTSPRGILDTFIYRNNNIDATNTFGIAIFDRNGLRDLSIANQTLNDSNFGVGNLVQYNSFNGNSNMNGLVAVNLYANVSSFNLTAEKNWWGDCAGPGGEGSGLGDNVTTNVDFDPWIGTCITNKTRTPGLVFDTSNVTLYANITSGVCVDNVIFSVGINGTWQNYTGGKSAELTNYSFTINASQLSGGDIFNWTVFASDCYNHTTQNGMLGFFVRSRTNHSISPSTPDGLNNWYVNLPLFTLNPDLRALQTWYRWDSLNETIYTVPFYFDWNATFGGTETLYFRSNFTEDVEPWKSININVDLKKPVITDLTPANNSQIFNDRNPEISAEIDEVYQDNSGVNLSSVVMRLDGVIINATVNVSSSIDAYVNYTPTANLSFGQHNVSVFANDNAGWYSELNWSFNITTASVFSMQVLSPVHENYYGSRKVRLDVLLGNGTGRIDYIDWSSRNPRWKRLCRSCTEYNKTKTFKGGKFNETLGRADSWHNLTIRATSDGGDIMQTNMSFFTDRKVPRISRIRPKKKSIVNGSEFFVKYKEDNLQNVTLWYGNGAVGFRNVSVANCSAGRNKNCSAAVNLTDYHGQSITYWFNLTDIIRTVGSRIYNVTVDTIDPVLNVSSPVTNSTYSRRVQFNMSVSEVVKRIDYYDQNASKPRWKRLKSNRDSYGVSRLKRKSFKVGNHSLIIRATDYAGNSDEEKVNIEIIY